MGCLLYTSGSIHKTPDARTIENARYLLENGSICPENVVGPVSYTHLDVYKRQLVNLPGFLENMVRTSVKTTDKI